MEVGMLPISASKRGKLLAAGYTSLHSISRASASQLATVLWTHQLGIVILLTSMTAWTMLNDEKFSTRIMTSCVDLDNILGGGITCKEVTELGGVPGIGKTQIGIQLAVNVQIPLEYGGLGGKAYTLVRALIISITHATFDLLRSFIGIFSPVLYSDIEGSFMVERVLQIAEACIEDMSEYSHHFHNNVQDCEVKMHPNSILENIFDFRVCSYTEQIALVNYLDKFIEEHKNVKIIIIDSVTFHFRQDFDDMALRTRLLNEMALKLMKLARKFCLAAQLSQGTSSGGTPSTPGSRPTDGTRTLSEDLVLTEGGTEGSGRGVDADDDVVVVSLEGTPRKRKRSEDVESENLVEGEGEVPSVMDHRFDAPTFIDEFLMLGMEDFFRECDVTFQAKSLYRSLLRSAVIVRKAEPVMAQVGLLDKKFRQSQAEVARLKGLLADAESARERAVKLSEESGAEILRLFEVEPSLLSQLGEERRKASDAESRLAVLLADVGTLKDEVAGLKAEAVVLKEEKAVLLADVKEAVAATEETMRAQAAVLAPGVDVSVMGAFKAVRDGQIVDLE
ncbi:hypothetical protein Ahy_B07g086300 [Arachis hypogaea]|uniref:DNA repair protein RAD51 homolog 3 n=1 Tax=Arachis hypogaea TaxID=3818 RepID=A0A444Y9C7_ARAHY|nr:hypothetical protein Ahy_B07g086300 [Arachis hypogaea]